MKLASCSFLFIEMMQPTKSLAPSSSTTVATLLMYATLIFHLHLAHCSSPFSSKPKFGPHKLGKCSLAFSYSQRNSGARLSAKLSSIRRNIATTYCNVLIIYTISGMVFRIVPNWLLHYIHSQKATRSLITKKKCDIF